MPKSKRLRPRLMNKVKRKGKPVKEQLVVKIRESIEEYNNVYVFEFDNMRNNSLKELRDDHNDSSRFYCGKTSVMRIALGRTPQDECKDNLSQLATHVIGNRGLFFTKDAQADVVDKFEAYSVENYARSGATCTDAFTLSAGPLPADIAPFSMEPQLRKLGLPTKLHQGIVSLLNDVTVCTPGDILTPEQCKILELFDQKQAVFRVRLLYVYTDGVVTTLNESKHRGQHIHHTADVDSQEDDNDIDFTEA